MTKKKAKKNENRFTRKQILASKSLTYSKDLIDAILQDDETYSLKEVKSIINKYLKGKVK